MKYSDTFVRDLLSWAQAYTPVTESIEIAQGEVVTDQSKFINTYIERIRNKYPADLSEIYIMQLDRFRREVENLL